MPYIAKRPVKVDGQMRYPGSAVSEADNWKRVDDWVQSGHLERVATSEEEEDLESEGGPGHGPPGPDPHVATMSVASEGPSASTTSTSTTRKATKRKPSS